MRLLLSIVLVTGCGATTPPLAAIPANHADRAVFVMRRASDGVLRTTDLAMAGERFRPMSTFKVPNTLVALETGVASDANFALPWDGVNRDHTEWNRDQTLETALRDSVVWYYQELARRAGHEHMDRLVRGMRYGNADIGGADRLDHFWLDGPLAISPRQQVEFLERLQRGELPVSSRSLGILRDIMPRETYGTAVLRGKTGTSDDADGCFAWWVGWVEDGPSRTTFATLLVSHDRTRVDALTAERKPLTRALLAREGVIRLDSAAR